MKKHCLLWLLAVLFETQPLQAIREYHGGQTLYVWAVSGLTLRTEPKFKADKILSLSYGTAVTVQTDKQFEGIDTSEIELATIPPYRLHDRNYSGYKIPGQWVKVTAQGKTGFVFDGYLCIYPPARQVTDGSRKFAAEDWDGYLDRVFKIACTSPMDTMAGAFGGTMRLYKNGASCLIRPAGDGLSSRTFFLPRLSLEEGYLMANFFYGLDRQTNLPVENNGDGGPILLVEATPHNLCFKTDGVDIRVGAVDGVVVLYAFFYC